ncbi:Wadjet anti-phage system protein JetD domain-containing protein [Thalassotalea sp. G20_0]
MFITENKVNGLAFPPVADAIVIFGLGYGNYLFSRCLPLAG